MGNLCTKLNDSDIPIIYQAELYNDDYGYRSGVNQSMIDHLTGVTNDIQKIIEFKKNDHVLDIASNDATLSKSYKSKKIKYFGIDPTINK